MTLYERLEGGFDPSGPEDEAATEGLAATDASRAGDAFPQAALSGLLRGPLGYRMTPTEEGGGLVWDRLMRLCARLAERDLELTLCVGGVVLGSLPLVVAGDSEQRRRFFGDLRSGEAASLGLSEWAHGSDLLRNETVAVPLDGGAFRLTGHKRPTNNGSRGRNVVVLARTGAPDDPFGATLFLLRRPLDGLERDAPVEWSGVPCMDLSGVRLNGVEVGSEAVLGKVGEGFVNARRVLETSRSGVACMATGAHASAVAQAWDHARERRLYGAPVSDLDGVRRLLCRSFARLSLGVATARFAARVAGRWGASARDWTCAAKLTCPALLEHSVNECGVVLGARSLTAETSFWRLRRDAPILGIFDGSSQLMLDELWRHVRTWPTTLCPPGRDPYAAVEGFDPWAVDVAAGRAATPPARLDGPLGDAARRLVARAREARDSPQRVRFQISEAAAWLYGITALQDAARRGGEVEGAALRQAVADGAPALAGGLTALGEPAAEVLALAEDVTGETWEVLTAWW